MTKKILSADELLGLTTLPTVEVEIPELDGVIKVRGLRKAEQVSIRNAAIKPNGELDASVVEKQMLLLGIVEPAFAPEDVEKLQQLSAGVYDRILLEIAELSGSTDAAVANVQRTFRPGA